MVPLYNHCNNGGKRTNSMGYNRYDAGRFILSMLSVTSQN